MLKTYYGIYMAAFNAVNPEHFVQQGGASLMAGVQFNALSLEAYHAGRHDKGFSNAPMSILDMETIILNGWNF